jgi:hypothetical protein
MTPASRSYTATDYGGPEVRVRRAIEQALGSELQIDAREGATEALIAAGLGDRVARYYRELDRFFASMAGAVVAQSKPLSNEVGAIHETAAQHERERLERAPRISGLVRGPVAS